MAQTFKGESDMANSQRMIPILSFEDARAAIDLLS
jgi:hypothetical protein